MTTLDDSVGIRIPSELLLKIDELAKKKYSNRSQVAREAIAIGISNMK